MQEEIQKYANHLRNNYAESVNANYNPHFDVIIEDSPKYVKITVAASGAKQTHSFIVKENELKRDGAGNTKQFLIGDILIAKDHASPALVPTVGNVYNPESYRDIRWSTNFKSLKKRKAKQNIVNG